MGPVVSRWVLSRGCSYLSAVPDKDDQERWKTKKPIENRFRPEFTQMLQKSRMLQIRDGKDEALLRYCKPLPTKEIQHYTTFPEGLRPLRAYAPEGKN
jgi:hypothetical protein